MKTKILSILALLLTVTQGAWALDGSGTVGSPYLLQTYDDWTTFVSNVNNGTYATTACAKLMCDIIGTTYRIDKAAYSGTFDGNGYTITRSNTSGAGAMPIFPTVNGATIKNLHVGGSFTFDADNKGALIGMASGTTTVENCRVSAEISYTQTTVNSGCIVGGNEGTLTINGCVFDGNLTVVDGAAELGGIVRSTSTATGRDCVFKPASITGTPSTYCSAIGRGSTSLSNSYFFTALSSTNDFNPARSISAGTDVTISGLGDATATYNVSGITAYAAGIKYNGVYYAKNPQTVTLTLSHADKAGYTFNQYAVAGGGTLTAQTETSATLSMTDANQTINATWTPTYTADFADGNDNTGWTIDPASGVEGATVTVSYSGENKVKSVTVQAKP